MANSAPWAEPKGTDKATKETDPRQSYASETHDPPKALQVSEMPGISARSENIWQGNRVFIDLGFSQRIKTRERICGDAFKFHKSEDGSKISAVLADGYGNGVRANVLASMAAVMGLKFAIQDDSDLLRAAKTTMNSIPVVGAGGTLGAVGAIYAAFTMVNAVLKNPDEDRTPGKTEAFEAPEISRKESEKGFGTDSSRKTALGVAPVANAWMAEMGNPEFLYFQDGNCVMLDRTDVQSETWPGRTMRTCRFEPKMGGRIVFFSDGVFGTKGLPEGWGRIFVLEHVEELLRKNSEISSQELCESILQSAIALEPNQEARDDMTCVCIGFRRPRKILLFTGPPYNGESDRQCALYLDAFDGAKVVCGGTTSEIVARELHREIRQETGSVDPNIPPASEIDGIDLVTEGVFTLTRVAEILENYNGSFPKNPAGRLAYLLLRNDVVVFLVGTRVNDAHLAPNLPQDIDFRRNIATRVARALREYFYKETVIRYV